MCATATFAAAGREILQTIEQDGMLHHRYRWTIGDKTIEEECSERAGKVATS